MNKPTESGHYWVRQSHKNLVTGLIQKGYEEIVFVCLSPIGRKQTGPRVLKVFGKGWQQRLDAIPDDWQWGKKIINDLPPFSVVEKPSHFMQEIG